MNSVCAPSSQTDSEDEGKLREEEEEEEADDEELARLSGNHCPSTSSSRRTILGRPVTPERKIKTVLLTLFKKDSKRARIQLSQTHSPKETAHPIIHTVNGS